MIRDFVSVILLAAAAMQLGSACAQGYPNETIRVIIPASPGDSCDTLTRLVGQKVGERLGQQLAVDNRPGAGRDFEKWGKLVRDIGFKPR